MHSFNNNHGPQIVVKIVDIYLVHCYRAWLGVAAFTPPWTEISLLVLGVGLAGSPSVFLEAAGVCQTVPGVLEFEPFRT